MSSRDDRTTLILGAGVMGTALSFPLADSGGEVTLVGTHLDDAWIDALQRSGVHPKLTTPISDRVSPLPYKQLGAALAREPGLIVVGVSSPGIPWAIRALAEHLQVPVPLLLLTKGLAARDGQIIPLTEFVANGIAGARGWSADDLPTGGVGGPCIAAELAERRETLVVIGAAGSLADLCRNRFTAGYYHPHYSRDVEGVEVTAALKNCFAIGVGTAARTVPRPRHAGDGPGAHNPAAALFAQALTEMAYLVPALGGRSETVTGQAGAGDLYVTCQAGRNRRLGALLGSGLLIGAARRQMAGETVEGADLAAEIGPVLRAMMRRGTLDESRLPLTRAILETVVDGSPWQMPDMGGFAQREE